MPARAPRIGARVSRQVLDLAAAAGVAGDAPPPSRMRDLLAAGKPAMKQVRKLFEQVAQMNEGNKFAYDRDALVKMLDDAIARAKQGR